jgi:hypothetical protein
MKKNIAFALLVALLAIGQNPSVQARDWVTPNAMLHSEQLYVIGATSQPRPGSWIYLSQFTKPPISTNRPCFTGTGYLDSSGKKTTSENGLYNYCGEEEILREFSLKPSSVRANIQLEVCNPENQTFCIEEFTFEGPEKVKTSAQFDRYVSETFFYNHKTPAIPELKIPRGGTPALWRAPGFKHQGGQETYLSDVRINIGWDPSGEINYSQLSISVVPYSLTPLSSLPSYKKVRTGQSSNLYSAQGKECAGPVFVEGGTQYFETNLCPQQEDLVSDVRVGIVLRTPQGVGGWFQGRVGAPDIQITSINQDVKRISISGTPITFPKAVAITKKGQSGWVRGGTFLFAEDSAGTVTTDKALLSLKKSTGDRASGQVTEWAIKAVGATSWCSSDPSLIAGIVTSNALAYQGSPITWNGKFLQFLLGGLHLNSDGSVMKGNLDVVINSQIARCLYQISDLPIEAQVQVSYPDGQAINVATQTVKEEVANGFIYLNAKNFTFSNPAIQIYLKNAGTLTPPKLQTIVCKKGKVQKNVTSVNPKCPTGFSKG